MNQKKTARSTDEATESISPSYPRIYLVLNPAAAEKWIADRQEHEPS